ncbi:MAG: hypothetical protein Solumvirus4_1, partial [Solumvirus sp.]
MTSMKPLPALRSKAEQTMVKNIRDIPNKILYESIRVRGGISIFLVSLLNDSSYNEEELYNLI